MFKMLVAFPGGKDKALTMSYDDGVDTDMRLIEWMEKIGVKVTLSDLGATEDMIEGMADATIILKGGYRVLDRDAVVKILKESL